QFDADSRSSNLGIDFGNGNRTYYLHENPHENDGIMNRTDNTGDTSVDLITKLASKAGGDPWVVMGTWAGTVGNPPSPAAPRRHSHNNEPLTALLLDSTFATGVETQTLEMVASPSIMRLLAVPKPNIRADSSNPISIQGHRPGHHDLPE